MLGHEVNYQNNLLALILLVVVTLAINWKSVKTS